MKNDEFSIWNWYVKPVVFLILSMIATLIMTLHLIGALYG